MRSMSGRNSSPGRNIGNSLWSLVAAIFMLFMLPSSLNATLDVGTTQVLFPKGLIRWERWNGHPPPVAAQMVVKNFGESPVSFSVLLKVDTVLVGTAQVESLAAQTTDTLEIPFALPESLGHLVSCSTALTGDEQPANDRLQEQFMVVPRDVIFGSMPPWDTARMGDIILLSARVHNFGPGSDTFPVLLAVTRVSDSQLVFADTMPVHVDSGHAVYVFSRQWIPPNPGAYRCLFRIDTVPLVDTAGFFLLILPLGVEEGASQSQPGARLVCVSPNPMTDRATVRFRLAREQPVHLYVCDLTGRTVAVLADGILGPGAYRRDWHAAPNVPNGVYFLSFAAGADNTVQKLVLTR
jgi:hypothetical protein